MGYLQEFEQELKARLATLEEREQKEVIRFVKEKILENYHNGQADAQAREQLTRLSTALTKHGQNLQDRPASGWRQLPIVKLGKERYYRDDRLQEYRNIKNPHDRILFKPEALD